MAPELLKVTARSSRTSFWPSISAASAELHARRLSPGRELPQSPAVLRTASPELLARRRSPGDVR